jgi:hypothetical protein
VAWFQGKTLRRLRSGQRVRVLTNQPLTLAEPA